MKIENDDFDYGVNLERIKSSFLGMCKGTHVQRHVEHLACEMEFMEICGKHLLKGKQMKLHETPPPLPLSLDHVLKKEIDYSTIKAKCDDDASKKLMVEIEWEVMSGVV